MVCVGVFLAFRIFGATPLHHYNFNGDGVIDLVGLANGTLQNGATVASGMLVLDGVDDYVQFGERLIPTAGSFSVIFSARELSPSSDRMEIISQGCSYCPGFYVGYYPSPMMRVGDEWQNTGVSFPSDELFHHYAVTMDDQETRLYIDGNLVATNPPVHLSVEGDATRLGMQFQSWGENFHGNIEELWVFNGSLTESEVKVFAASQMSPSVDSLIDQVNKSTLSAQRKRPLLGLLKVAKDDLAHGHCEAGIRRLKTFLKTVKAQISQQDATLANALMATAQAIIDRGCGSKLIACAGH